MNLKALHKEFRKALTTEIRFLGELHDCQDFKNITINKMADLEAFITKAYQAGRESGYDKGMTRGVEVTEKLLKKP